MKTAQEKNHQIQKKTLVGLEILSGVLVINANQWLFMQKAFAAWINIKFVEVILSFIFEIFLSTNLLGGSENSVVLGFCLL